MKKTIGFAAVALAGVLCCGIAACGSSELKPNEKPNDQEVVEQEHVHTFNVSNVCSQCGEKWNFTEGIHCLPEGYSAAFVTSAEKTISGAVVIPYGYNDSRLVTRIGPSAFSNCTEMTSITLPGYIASINEWAFMSCENLTKIIFDGTKSEWEGVKKEDNWDYGTGDYTVECRDGTIAKATK